MLLVIGTFRLPPRPPDEARVAMCHMILASRAEEGCLAYAYAEDVLEPGPIHVHEAWRDQACLGAHFTSDHLAEWRASWPALRITDRDLVLYDAGAPCPT